MIDFILEERRPDGVHKPWSKWLTDLMQTDFPRFANGMSYRKRFLNWISILDVKEKEGKDVLCVKASKVTIPCMEELSRIIRNAHRETGEFASECNKNINRNSLESQQPKHNQVEKCLRLVSQGNLALWMPC